MTRCPLHSTARGDVLLSACACTWICYLYHIPAPFAMPSHANRLTCCWCRLGDRRAAGALGLDVCRPVPAWLLLSRLASVAAVALLLVALSVPAYAQKVQQGKYGLMTLAWLRLRYCFVPADNAFRHIWWTKAAAAALLTVSH